MKCLHHNGGLWCDLERVGVQTPVARKEALATATDSPRDATCITCLKVAGEYGAAAAMRYAAVEAGVTHDPELARERDEAIRKLDTFTEAVRKQHAFFCTSCEKLFPDAALAIEAGGVSWCENCAQAARKEFHS